VKLAAPTTVIVPYKPRPLQRVLHRALDRRRFVVAVCHRRFGKTVLAVNQLQKGALTCQRARPRFAYIGPTYRQAKATSWDFIQHYARPIPGIAGRRAAS
jgi:phage terminase large subunit